MTDTTAADPTIEPASDSPSQGRRLWERFSLVVMAFVLLILSQESFGILASSYLRTQTLAALPLSAFLGFGISGGFAFGLAVVLPARVALRHPRRGLTLTTLPVLVTALNVTFAVSQSVLPDALGQFTAEHLIGLQTISSVLIGVAAASAFAEN